LRESTRRRLSTGFAPESPPSAQDSSTAGERRVRNRGASWTSDGKGVLM
jgi:hypothetical protein